MKIDDRIQSALREAIEEEGNIYRFSLTLKGIRHTTIRDWLNGKVKSISDENWEKLYPVIHPYLFDDPDEHPEEITGYRLSLSDDPEIKKDNSKINMLAQYNDVARLLPEDCVGGAFNDLIKCLSRHERARLMKCLIDVKFYKEEHKQSEVTFEFYTKEI